MAKIKDKYSLIIIGTGPAGLTASIYASRYKIDHLIIGEALGGLAFEAHKICNFPTEEEISGRKFVKKIQNHTESLGVSLIMDKVVGIVRKRRGFKVVTRKGKIFLTDTILFAIGTKCRQLNLPNEDKFIGRGVSYCATCDAMFYRNKVVAVIGGSDSANTASLYLAETAKKVYQIYRKSRLRGETAWVNQVVNNPKIRIIYNRKIIGLKGRERLEKIILDTPYQKKNEIAVNGLFIEIGTVPQKALIGQASLKTDKNGYIKVDLSQKTSQVGIWAAGDITTASDNFHQIITACSEGAIAIKNIYSYLMQNK